MIRSAVLREQEMTEGVKKSLSSSWEDIVQHIFKDDKEDHDRLQNKFMAVLSGSAIDQEFTKECTNSQGVVTAYNNGLQGSQEHRLQNLLSGFMTCIMLVD